MNFRETIEWIAKNDDPGEIDIASIEQYISTQLAADILGRPARDIAVRVAGLRRDGKHYCTTRFLSR